FADAGHVRALGAVAVGQAVDGRLVPGDGRRGAALAALRRGAGAVDRHAVPHPLVQVRAGALGRDAVPVPAHGEGVPGPLGCLVVQGARGRQGRGGRLLAALADSYQDGEAGHVVPGTVRALKRPPAALVRDPVLPDDPVVA